MINRAKAIWTDKVIENQYIEAMRIFEACEKKKGIIQICADSDYSVHINGRIVGFGQWRTFPGKKAYDEYDITDFLREGENVLMITAYHQGKDCSVCCRDTAFLAYAVSIDGAKLYSDENTLVREHPNYKSGDMEMITPQLGYSFCYDASKNGGEWKNASVTDDFTAQYFKRPVKRLFLGETVTGSIKTQGTLIRSSVGSTAHMMQRDFLSFAENSEIFNGNTLKRNKDGVYFVIDLKENLSGYFTMTLNAAEGTVIDIGYGEHLDDMRVRTEIDGRNFAVRYVSRGGKQSFTGYFRRFGCRYIEIHITNMKENVEFNEIGLLPAWYPLSREAKFKTENYLFDKLYRACIKTLKMCMHEHYEDCPWREQALYSFDSYIQMLCGYYAFGEYEFAKASLWLLGDSQYESGVLRITAPGNSSITIPVFSLAWILSLEKYVLYSGDTEFGEDMLPIAKRVLDFFEVKNGLVINRNTAEYWNFVEWSDGLDGVSGCDSESDSVTNFYYIFAVEAYDRLCTYCGKVPYNENTAYMKTRIEEEFFDNEGGFYITRRGDARIHELTQAFAVLADMPEADKLASVLAEGDNAFIKTTLSTSLFKYEALLKYGELYSERVLDDMAEVYGNMLFAGADTLWETSEGAAAFDNAGSLCHAWSAVPVYILYRYYVGFKPESPGLEKYSVSPIKNTILGNIKTQLLMPGKVIDLTV